MMLHFARAPIIVLTLEFKKCFIKYQESTVRFIVMAAQESVIFIHVPKAAGTTLNPYRMGISTPRDLLR